MYLIGCNVVCETDEFCLQCVLGATWPPSLSWHLRQSAAEDELSHAHASFFNADNRL